jgi:hypothetical protein
MSYDIKQSRVIGSSRGSAAVEFAFILPLLIVLVFGIIDFGRLVHARLVVTNVSREAANLASRYRDIEIQQQADDLLLLLSSSGTPLSLEENGKIIITKINAGTSTENKDPVIAVQRSRGGLSVGSCLVGGQLGLSLPMYEHLVFKEANQTADISEITVAEVFYKYRPITPLPNFIEGILLTHGDGIIIGSKSVF